MREFRVEYKSGVSWEADSKTLLGAKREASKNACVGYGRICIYETECSDPLCVKYEKDDRWTMI